MLCVRHLLGLGCPKDYHLPQTLLITPVLISIEQSAVIVSAACAPGELEKQCEFLLLRPTSCQCQHAFEAALRSLTEFVHNRQSMFVRFVENRRRDCRVLVDVQQYNPALCGRRADDDEKDCDIQNSEDCLYEPLSADVMRKDLLACRHAMTTMRNCYFTYTVEHGAVIWIAALRSGEHGNRFPIDERTHSVIRFKTLEKYLRSSATM